MSSAGWWRSIRTWLFRSRMRTPLEPSSPPPRRTATSSRFSGLTSNCSAPTSGRGGVSDQRDVPEHPGPEILAAWAAPAATIAGGLGRAPSGNVQSVTLPLVAPGTMYGKRLQQIDVRVAEEFSLQRGIRAPGVRRRSICSTGPRLSQNNTFGALWQNPTAFLGARQAKVGFLLRF